MTNKLDIFKCDVCGNIVEVIIPAQGELVCCNEPMKLLEAQSVDEGLEKHVPVLIKNQEGKNVIKIGSIPHPMEEKHYIEFIEIISNDKKLVKRKYFSPHNEPEMKIKCDCMTSGGFEAVEYCNIHGLWGNKFEGEN